MNMVNRTSDFTVDSQCFRDAVSGFQNLKYSTRFTRVCRGRKSRSESIGDLKANWMNFHENGKSDKRFRYEFTMFSGRDSRFSES